MCGDFLMWWCCNCCAAIQEARQVNDAHGSKGDLGCKMQQWPVVGAPVQVGALMGSPVVVGQLVVAQAVVAPVPAQSAASPVGSNQIKLYLVRDADFKGRDQSSESCASPSQVAGLIAAKPHGKTRDYKVASVLRGTTLYTVRAVGRGQERHGARWSSGASLYVFGLDTGHRSQGKILIALQDVDCCFGDGRIESCSSYQTAVDMVKQKPPNEVAHFLHTPSRRLIAKPKNNGCFWVGYPGYGWLFLWADECAESSAEEDPIDEDSPETNTYSNCLFNDVPNLVG